MTFSGHGLEFFGLLWQNIDRMIMLRLYFFPILITVHPFGHDDSNEDYRGDFGKHWPEDRPEDR